MKLSQIIISGLVLLFLDYIYLSTTSLYFNKIIKSIQGNSISMKPIGIVISYFFIILGLNYFIIANNLPIKDAFILGITTYGIYDGTNYAILNNLPLKAVFLDTIWGGILYGLTTYFTYKLQN